VFQTILLRHELAHTHSRFHTLSPSHTHAQSNTRTHTHARTHIHTHTHTLSLSLSLSLFFFLSLSPSLSLSLSLSLTHTHTQVGCLAERCRSTVMSKHGENLDYATPGCPVEKVCTMPHSLSYSKAQRRANILTPYILILHSKMTLSRGGEYRVVKTNRMA